VEARLNQQNHKRLEVGMKSRAAIWATVGLLIAGVWAIYAFVTPPESFLMSLKEPLVRAALYLSCPVSYAGRYYPIHFGWVLLINAVTYGVFGMILEILRPRSKPRLPA
jgi:hypothetical protein